MILFYIINVLRPRASFLPSLLSFPPALLAVQKVQGAHGGTILLYLVCCAVVQMAAVLHLKWHGGPSRTRTTFPLTGTNGRNEEITHHWLGNISAAVRTPCVCRAASRKR